MGNRYVLEESEWTDRMSFAGGYTANVAGRNAAAGVSSRTLNSQFNGNDNQHTLPSDFFDDSSSAHHGNGAIRSTSQMLNHPGLRKSPSDGTGYNSDTHMNGSVSTAIEHEKTQHFSQHETVEDLETTRTRHMWTAITWVLTWWIPTPLLKTCGRMKRQDVRMAWREKTAICIIIFFVWILLLFIIIGLGLILCPRENVWTLEDIKSHNTEKDALIAMRGRVYDITDYLNQKHGVNSFVAQKDMMLMFAGQDINASFPISIRTACPSLISQKDDPKFSMYLTPADLIATQVFPFTHKVGTMSNSKKMSDPNFYAKYVVPTLNLFKKGGVVWDYKWVDSMHKDQGKYWRIINGEVFNLDDYFATIDAPGNNKNAWRFLNHYIENIFDDRGAGSTDITDMWKKIHWTPQEKEANYHCMKNLFYVGRVDGRQSVRCLFTNYMLLAFACLLMLIVGVKFLTALQLGTKNRPTPPQKFIVCQVPCYTEDESSLAKTINSLCSLDYDDKHKLIFIICDGNIVGSGNDRPTPRIVLDVLGVDPEYDPPGRDYLAIAEGSRRHNVAKIYSGLYEYEGHVVPFMVVAKIGTPEEANRSGNRGKRDSQILLMSFFNKVHFDLPMTPLELEVYHQIRHIIGINPNSFEFILQIDADTEVMPDSLTRLVSACSSDQRIAGICGETMLGNESKSWTTMMQVYEYFISHHMSKAFESLFGSVTCLPGCFCMYRLRSIAGKPLLISNQVLEAYSELHVDTLHKKNLLSLGEDRYLTTLMMKHFPQFKLKFIQDAKCKTIAPEKWSILMSQRRRWINSTIHNLAELMFLQDLCGFCCFSMRFVVFLDLFGTITMPTTLIYFGYLIFVAVTDIADVGYISLILIASIYGLQAIIFILRREWQHFGWMIIYLCAYPLWSFVLPIYSFWHMDDFSWGNTRVVVGDGKRKIITEDEKSFDPGSIPQRRWIEYETELTAAGVLNAPPPNMNPNAGSNKEEERTSMNSRLSSIIPSNTGGGSSFGYSAHTSIPGTVMYSATRSATPSTMIPHNDQYQSSNMPVPSTAYGLPYTGSQSIHQLPGSDVTQVNQAGYSVAISTPTIPGSSRSTSVYITNTYSYGQLHGLNGSNILQENSTPSYGLTYLQQQQSRPSTIYGTTPLMTSAPVGSTQFVNEDSLRPTDDQLIDAIRRILTSSDLTTMTKKQIRAQLNQEFNSNMNSRRDFISGVVDRMLSGVL